MNSTVGALTGVMSSPPQSRTEYVTERIKEDVANGVISPGELIKQTALAKRYGVSPTPVREALRILEADGVITYAPHKGASVREMTPESARDLYRLRAAVDQAATQMAVERMTPAGLAAVRRKYNDISEAIEAKDRSPAQLSLLNRAFHFSIYEHASTLVVQHLELLWSRFTPATTLFIDEKHAVDLHGQHYEILEALESGDAELAGRLCAAHAMHAAELREHKPELRAAGHDEGDSLV